MKINGINQPNLEFIEIEQEEGDRITGLVLLTIKALAQYRTNINDLANNIKLLPIDKQRRDFLQEVANELSRKYLIIWRN